MNILVVCKNLYQAQNLYFQYINTFRIMPTPYQRMHLECTVPLTSKVRFITEAQLEIAQQGNHDVKIVSGADVQYHILKTLRQGGK